MPHHSGISDIDRDLFRTEAGPVVPVQQSTVNLHAPKPDPVPLQALADERQVVIDMASGPFNPDILETGDELAYRQAGVQARISKKLKSGHIRIEAEIDLHGMTVKIATKQINEFFARCRARNKNCVKIIHGKGLGSRNGMPVLKNKLGQWLRQRSDVLAFCSAKPADGGTGAIYVLLKKLR
jgi:DNA-nicking Smr family endonuclease